MAIEILGDHNQACMFCTTTDWAFGPVFIGDDASDRAEWFLAWHKGKYGDPRSLDDSHLQAHYAEWLALKDASTAECYWCDAPIYPGDRIVDVIDGELHTAMHESCACKHREEYKESDVKVA